MTPGDWSEDAGGLMKQPLRLLVLAALALAACAPQPAPSATPALPTIAADLPTTLAAFQLPAAATVAPSPAPLPSPTLPAFLPTVTPVPFTPLPAAPII